MPRGSGARAKGRVGGGGPCFLRQAYRSVVILPAGLTGTSERCVTLISLSQVSFITLFVVVFFNLLLLLHFFFFCRELCFVLFFPSANLACT